MESNRKLIIYQSEDGTFKLQVELEGQTVWLSQEQMARLFFTSKQNISYHIGRILATNEVKTEQGVKESLTPVDNGQTHRIVFYNLDVIIAVGYRVNSHVATRFRQWATQTLKEYIVKGFAMDDRKLAEGNNTFGKDYFDELTERVRAIRMSERRFYEKVTAIFSETSYDYDSGSNEAKDFYATIQNKFHHAVTGKTAAEIIVSRIDATKPQAGLTVIKGQHPTVAKNYLLEEELRRLYLISEQFLSFAELRMTRKNMMTMNDWQQKLNEMLALNDLQILQDKGGVSRDTMAKRVRQELRAYNAALPLPRRIVQENDGSISSSVQGE